MYKTGFQANLMGPASVIAVILVLVGLVLALLLRRLGGSVEREPAGRGLTWRRRDHRRHPDGPRTAPSARSAAPRAEPNWLGGLAGWLWLVIVIIPIYWIVITSFKTQDNYFSSNPLAPPTSPTLDNYRLVIQSDFPRYFVNSVIVTIGAIVPAVLRLVHGGLRDRPRRRETGSCSGINALFLMGLAIPLQAVDHPGLPDHHQAAACTTPCWR